MAALIIDVGEANLANQLTAKMSRPKFTRTSRVGRLRACITRGLKSLTPNTIIKDNVATATFSLGRKPMNETHKGHKIIVSASRQAATRQWEPRLTVIWSEDGNGRLSKLTVNRAFRVRREAEMEGLIFAKKWIDDGKPDLSLNPAMASTSPANGGQHRPIARSPSDY
jgi:hypothetical protein